MVAALCMVAPAVAFDWTNLPYDTEVTVISGNAVTSGAYFDLYIGNDIHPTWCADTATIVNSVPYQANLSTTIGAGEEWNKINWVLNNKGNTPVHQIQAAIWTIRGQTLRWDRVAWYTNVAEQLVNEAEAHGDFIPECGQIGAVLVKPCVGVYQDTIFEVQTPECIPEPVPEFPTMMIPVFLVGSLMVAASVLKKE